MLHLNEQLPSPLHPDRVSWTSVDPAPKAKTISFSAFELNCFPHPLVLTFLDYGESNRELKEIVFSLLSSLRAFSIKFSTWYCRKYLGNIQICFGEGKEGSCIGSWEALDAHDEEATLHVECNELKHHQRRAERSVPDRSQDSCWPSLTLPIRSIAVIMKSAQGPVSCSYLYYFKIIAFFLAYWKKISLTVI